MTETFDHTEKQAAHVLGVAPRTLRRWRKSGLIMFYELPGGRIRYSTEQIAAFILSRRNLSSFVRLCPPLSS